jgi:hypothetical protein
MGIVFGWFTVGQRRIQNAAADSHLYLIKTRAQLPVGHASVGNPNAVSGQQFCCIRELEGN